METEEQQLEEIRKWWKEYGRTVVLGVVIGLSGIGGWGLWKAHVNTQAETASALYQLLQETAASGTAQSEKSAIAQTDALINQYPKSSYAALGALIGARGAYQQDDTKAAKRFLEWAIDNTKVFEISTIARLRLARILTEQGQNDAALKQLESIKNTNFSMLENELRGDVLQAKGDTEGARSAYRKVLHADNVSQSILTNIQLKIDALDANT